jgi:hypothetical protein
MPLIDSFNRLHLAGERISELEGMLTKKKLHKLKYRQKKK